jgi:protein transport protein SEC61 subunit gamma-like protein
MSTKASTSSSTKKAKPAALPQTTMQAATEPMKKFIKDSIKLVKRCTKPDAKGALIRLSVRCSRFHQFPVVLSFAEFKKIAMATSVGFLVMGFIGFFVK